MVSQWSKQHLQDLEVRKKVQEHMKKYLAGRGIVPVRGDRDKNIRSLTEKLAGRRGLSGTEGKGKDHSVAASFFKGLNGDLMTENQSTGRQDRFTHRRGRGSCPGRRNVYSQ